MSLLLFSPAGPECVRVLCNLVVLWVPIKVDEDRGGGAPPPCGGAQHDPHRLFVRDAAVRAPRGVGSAGYTTTR
jgi:hypothetical protein